MTGVRLASSIEEIVASLAEGNASSRLQKDAAFVIPDIWRGRLPRGVSFNRRGRPCRARHWYAAANFEHLRIDEVWVEDELVRKLSTGTAAPLVQKFAAFRIIEAIHHFRVFEKQGSNLHASAGDLIGKPRKWMAVASILWLADKFNDQGSRRPIHDAMEAAAQIDECSIDTIKREYREGLVDGRRVVAPFLRDVDTLIDGGLDLIEALTRASQKSDSLCVWTEFMLSSLYRRAKQKR